MQGYAHWQNATLYHVSDTTTLGGFTNLHDVSYEKDLGVWTTNKVESSLHCQKAVSNANRFLGMVRRSMSKDLFMFLYKTYVRPHLEYCVQLWCPYLAKDMDLLEKVQMRATKLVKGNGRLPYTTRLQKLGLSIFIVYCRRQRGDLIET